MESRRAVRKPRHRETEKRKNRSRRPLAIRKKKKRKTKGYRKRMRSPHSKRANRRERRSFA